MIANAIVMMAGEQTAKKVEWGINEPAYSREDLYPSHKVPMGLDRIEVSTTQHKTGIFDYYIAVYDGHDKGEYNGIARWLTKILPDGINPTGNFVVLHKTWDDEEGEINSKIDIGLKELCDLFKP